MIQSNDQIIILLWPLQNSWSRSATAHIGKSFSFGRKTTRLGEYRRKPPALTHAKPKSSAETVYSPMQTSIQQQKTHAWVKTSKSSKKNINPSFSYLDKS